MYRDPHGDYYRDMTIVNGIKRLCIDTVGQIAATTRPFN